MQLSGLDQSECGDIFRFYRGDDEYMYELVPENGTSAYAYYQMLPPGQTIMSGGPVEPLEAQRVIMAQHEEAAMVSQWTPPQLFQFRYHNSRNILFNLLPECVWLHPPSVTAPVSIGPLPSPIKP